MELNGTVTNGVVVLDGAATVPEGTRVRVTVPPLQARAVPPADEPTMKWLLRYSGAIEDMPADFAEQHDHYIHGTPKR
jgi:hypothetical protein